MTAYACIPGGRGRCDGAGPEPHEQVVREAALARYDPAARAVNPSRPPADGRTHVIRSTWTPRSLQEYAVDAPVSASGHVDPREPLEMQSRRWPRIQQSGAREARALGPE